METRIVFMGSPEFAVPSLKLLVENFNVVGVVTQPDRPAGRGRKLQPPTIKQLAQDLDLPVIQPTKLKEAAAMEPLEEWAPEVIVVAAFGQILKPAVLELPAHGCINVHASLLPRWRGAAPIQACLLHGDAQTGITIMRMDAGVDTGPILSQRAIQISANETAGSLSPQLAAQGAELLIETLPGYLRGDITPEAQDNSQATYAPMLSKKDGELVFADSTQALARRVRAFNPWPGAFTHWPGGRLKVLFAHPSTSHSPGVGITAVHEGLPAIGTGDGLLVLDEVQPAGKKPMAGHVFLRGARNWSSGISLGKGKPG